MSADRPADVFVIFGITGDLAKKMTFEALYRLEARGADTRLPLLEAPMNLRRGSHAVEL